MEEADRNKLFLERMLKHQEQAKERKFYAIKRMDLLIVSVSGAGIYIVFEMIKFFYEKQKTENIWPIKLAGSLFAVAIIVNFFSQWTGYNANKNEVDSSELIIDKEKGDYVDEVKHNDIKEKIKNYNWLTSTLNTVSTILMLIGVIALVIYNLFIF